MHWLEYASLDYVLSTKNCMLTLCLQGIFSFFFFVVYCNFLINLFKNKKNNNKKSFQNTIWMSNSLDLDQVLAWSGSKLFERLSADDSKWEFIRS